MLGLMLRNSFQFAAKIHFFSEIQHPFPRFFILKCQKKSLRAQNIRVADVADVAKKDAGYHNTQNQHRSL